MQNFPRWASWIPSAQGRLESYMVKEGLKGSKNNQKKLKESYKMPMRKGGELRLLCTASFLIWLLHLVICGILGSVEQGPASHLIHCLQGMIYCLVHANTHNESYYQSWYDYFDYSVYCGWEWVIKIVFKCRFYLHRYWKISLFSKAFCYCSLYPGETSDAWSFPLAPQLWGNHIFLLAPLASQAMQRAGSTWDLNDNSLPGGK